MAVKIAWRSARSPRNLFFTLMSKCSNEYPAVISKPTPDAVMPWSFVTMSRLGWMTNALISLFCNAGTSCAESTTNWKMILSSDGLVLPHHLGFGTSSTDFSLFHVLILNGPALHDVS